MAEKQAENGPAKSGVLREGHKRIIQIIGTNGSGKTTLARSLIQHYCLKETGTKHEGKNWKVQMSDDGKFVVLGKYNGVICGGCDTIESGSAVKELIASEVRSGAETIVFEGILYSGSASFCKSVHLFASVARYDYKIVWMNRNVDECLNAVYKRNGGKQFNIKGVADRARSVERVAAQMRARGVTVTEVDPDNYGGELWRAID